MKLNTLCNENVNWFPTPQYTPLVRNYTYQSIPVFKFSARHKKSQILNNNIVCTLMQHFVHISGLNTNFCAKFIAVALAIQEMSYLYIG